MEKKKEKLKLEVGTQKKRSRLSMEIEKEKLKLEVGIEKERARKEEREADKVERLQKENKREVRLKKAADLLVNILTYMSSCSLDMLAYLKKWIIFLEIIM